METKNMAQEIWYWQHGGTNFRSQLFTLLMKADLQNLAKLGSVFPEEFAALQAWRYSDDENDYYERNGVQTSA